MTSTDPRGRGAPTGLRVHVQASARGAARLMGVPVKRSHLAGIVPALLSRLTTRRRPEPAAGRHAAAAPPSGPKHARQTKTRPARDADA